MPHTLQGLPRLSHVAVFNAVADGGSMRHAAEALHVTQPAVTYAIQTLERALRTRLFDRRQGGSYLTSQGDVFARRTQRLRGQMQAAIGVATGHPADSEQVARQLRRLTDIHIRSMAAIAGATSFRAAAAFLAIAEPTLHRAAHDVEKLLKIPLYRRAESGLIMLPAGTELARRLLLAMSELRAGIADIGASSAAGPPRLTLGILPLAPGRRLAQITQTLLGRHPALRISLLEGAYDDHVGALRTGAMDLIYGALRDTLPFDDLIAHPIFDDPYCIVCRSDHVLAGRTHLQPADLSPYGWVFPTQALPRRAVLDAMLRVWGLACPIQIETNAPPAITQAILASDRLALWPRSYIDADMSRERLAVVNLEVPHARRQVGITHRKDLLPTQIQAELLKALLAGGINPPTG